MVARAFSLAVEALVVALAGEAVDCLKQVRDARGVACQARHALVHHHEVPDAPGCVAHEPHCMEGEGGGGGGLSYRGQWEVEDTERRETAWGKGGTRWCGVEKGGGEGKRGGECRCRGVLSFPVSLNHTLTRLDVSLGAVGDGERGVVG